MRASTEVIGRDDLLRTIAAFLNGDEARQIAVVLQGEAGIGKTTLWRSSVSVAAEKGRRVLKASPAESEAGLPFGAAADLLEGVLEDVGDGLPGPQRRALEVALLLEDVEGRPVDQRAVSVAFLGAIRACAAAGPVVVAVDDIQWLDAESALALSFAARRVREEPVCFILARRTGSSAGRLDVERTFEHTGLLRLEVGPLSVGAVHRLLHERLGMSFARPTLLRLHEACAGNPFYALEIARALHRRGEVDPGRPLPLPGELDALVRERIAALPPEAREALAAAAATPHPTVSLVGAGRALDTAAEAGLIEVDGERVRFTHPLLRSAAYALAGIDGRMRIHRQLAHTATDPEERARHLALGADGPDSAIAAALDGAAQRAAARGATEAAAELARLALQATPGTDAEGVVRRRLMVAGHDAVAGEPVRARGELVQLLAEAPPGNLRATILFQLSSLREDDIAAAIALGEEALRESTIDDGLRSSIHSQLTMNRLIAGDLSGAREDASMALTLARSVAKPTQLAAAFAVLGLTDAAAGRPPPTEFWDEALASEVGADAAALPYSPSLVHGIHLMWRDRLDEARAAMEAALVRANAHGHEMPTSIAHFHLTELEVRAGRWDAASHHVRQQELLIDQEGFEQTQAGLMFSTALVAAHLGREREARRAAERGVDAAKAAGDTIFLIQCQVILGFLELSLGRPAEADAHLRPLWPLLTRMGYGEPSVYAVLPNAAEALIQLGELDKARLLLSELESRGRQLDSPWSLALAARGRGLLAAEQGDLEGALDAMLAAMTEHERMQGPFERARTLLALGGVQRRRKQKRAAREAIGSAVEVFDGLGAELWAANARRELARISGRTRSGDLTQTEQRVVALVAEGLSNKEVASALFVSVRAVEANLTRVYAKLGVRSRGQLIRDSARSLESD